MFIPLYSKQKKVTSTQQYLLQNYCNFFFKWGRKCHPDSDSRLDFDYYYYSIDYIIYLVLQTSLFFSNVGEKSPDAVIAKG